MHSERKPKPRGNHEKGDGESESDDDHRNTRQKTADKPLEKVESRRFACPFYKLYPHTHWRKCREICYPITGIYSVQVFAQDANSQSFNYVQKQAFANKGVQRHICEKHGPFDQAILDRVKALPKQPCPKKRWRELCKIYANVPDSLVPDDPCKLPLSPSIEQSVTISKTGTHLVTKRRSG
jgi:hypothetical protein